ncbi:predicted protein [Nematostella vectensis]|uniref:Uncharacterized protein n=1 Tax=Nematostella vectensis TaxID=45351 RepID=A7SQI8_NEMVE|nr:predicted protein [Nematostella vectensis]|eukprot:XP_001626131.1 predicted protein [Nematostella vectensis]
MVIYAKCGLMIAFLIAVFISPGTSIQCRLCWPPREENACKNSEQMINCDEWEDIGYTSCIQVHFPGNKSLSRTCYPTYKCDGALEWCSRYGPCSASCCKGNMCNGAHRDSAMYALYLVALGWFLLLLRQ